MSNGSINHLNGQANAAIESIAGEKSQPPFGPYEEEAIISLILDMPEFYMTISHFLLPDLFDRLEARYVMGWIYNLYEQYGVVPTRGLLRDRIIRQLTIDEPSWKDIMGLVGRQSNPREAPIIRTRLKDWARGKAYGMLYDEAAITAYQRGDFDRLEEIYKAVSRINDTTYRSFWFFDEFQSLLCPENIVRYTTGFKRLDKVINNGGPSPGESLVWLAATNTGKSIWLCNNSINSVANGLDTLHITFEMSAFKTARRCLGALTQIKLSEFHEHKEMIRRECSAVYAANGAKLAIYEMSPDTHSVNDIANLITMLRKTKGWSPKILVLDYLELMISKNDFYNRDEYIRQKHVATEVCGLAKELQTFNYTATQTNRSGTGTANSADVTELNKMAESFGKSMPPDYVVSLNQSKEEYEADVPQIRMYVAKNREGPKFVTINCNLSYETMKIMESVI